MRCLDSREKSGPGAAAVRLIDSHQERRDHLAQFRQHLAGARADLRQRVRAHAQQQRLERLSRAVDAEVRLRGRGQQAAQRVERLGANRGAMHGVRIGGALRIPAREVLLHRSDPRGVALERAVHRLHVPIAKPAVAELGRHVIPPSPVQLVRVRHVPRRLLEVRHQASPLEHLGQHVRDVLARDVRAAQLRDRVVAVLVEDLVEELFGAREANGRAAGAPVGDLVRELVEKQPPQGLG